MSDYILSFSTPNASPDTAGGKGANLAKLSQAGFPVPPGFIVSTRAYQDFVNIHDIQPKILAWTQNLTIDQPDSIERVSQAIYKLFNQAKMPVELGQQIISAYQALGDNWSPVAVRSSANAEDLPGFAFAGQQDTFLNVVGDQALLDALKSCWASLWTARAITYRSRNGFAQDAVALAVVVQTMIEAEVSGVMFTANPVTGKRQEIHMDASYGLGEALVSGRIDPDHYVVDSILKQIIERRIGTKKVRISTKVGGGTKQTNHHPDASQALTDADILELANIGLRVAAHFGEPQDIEWALMKGKILLLQSRPITSLYPLPENASVDHTLHIYFNFNAIQGVPDPLTPLGIDALRLLFRGVLETLGIHSTVEQVMPQAGSRLFLDFGNLPSDPILRKFVTNFLASVEPGERDILIHLIQDGRIPPRHVFTPGLAFRLMRSFRPLLFSALRDLIQYRTARNRIIQGGEDYINRVQEHLAAIKGIARHDLEVCLRAMEIDLPHAEQVSVKAMPLALAANNLVLLLNKWLTGWSGEPPGAAMPLLRSLSGNVTVEMNLRLWNAAQAIQADEPAAEAIRSLPAERLVAMYRQKSLPGVAQQSLEQFLKSDGIRGVAEIDLGKPRWQEDPKPIFLTLKGYLQLREPDLAPDRVYQNGAVQAERLLLEYNARIRKTRWGWLRSWLFQSTAHRVRALSSLREVPLYYLARVFSLYRQALLKIGQELMEQKVLDSPDDLFFIPLPILKEWVQKGTVDLKCVVSAQRAIYAREYLRKQTPRVLLSTGEAFYEEVEKSPGTGNQLLGTAVAPGIMEGIARVIMDAKDAHLEPGEIIVCPSTDPGWTPLFLTAGGLVMEIGGLMTHGSVVAREYGIPAVVGVRDATRQIHTGQHIRVDGNQGRVTIF